MMQVLVELADFEAEEEPDPMVIVLPGLVELADFEAEEEPDPITGLIQARTVPVIST